MKTAFAAIALASTLTPLSANAQGLKQHRLVVAANPKLGISDSEVDQILAKMNKIMATKVTTYNWDVPCPGVTFVRVGSVLTSGNLPVSGSFEDQAAKLNAIFP